MDQSPPHVEKNGYKPLFPDIIELGKLITKFKDLSFVDIGANIGAVVTDVLIHCNPVQCVTVEGDSWYFNFARENLSSYSENISLGVYLGEAPKVIKGEQSRNSGTGSLSLNGQNLTDMEISTLDVECRKYKVRPSLLKIDTDGWDARIIFGASETLRNFKPVLYFEYSPMHQVLLGIEDDSSNVFKFLDKMGYSSFHFVDKSGHYFAKFRASDIAVIRDISVHCITVYGGMHYNITCFHDQDHEIENIFERSIRKLQSAEISSRYPEKWKKQMMPSAIFNE